MVKHCKSAWAVPITPIHLVLPALTATLFPQIWEYEIWLSLPGESVPLKDASVKKKAQQQSPKGVVFIPSKLEEENAWKKC